MALRFRRRIKIAPGFRVNVGKRGVSVSAGVRGANITAGRRGVYGNVGMPGTGLSYRSKLGNKRSLPSDRNFSSPSTFSGTAALDFLEDGSIEIKDEEGNVLPQKYIKIGREQNKDVFDNWLKSECDRLNADIDKVLNIHLDTTAPDQNIVFTPEPYGIPKPKFFDPGPPQLKEVGLFAKFLSSKKAKIEEENRKKIEMYQENYQHSQKKHEAAFRKWQVEKQRHEKLQKRKHYLIKKGRFDNTELMAVYLEEVLKEVCWPRETLISLDVQNGGKRAMMDVDLPEIEDMPRKSVSIAKSGLKLNIKNRTDTQIRKDYMFHVHGIGFRVIGETFTALPTVDQVVLAAYSQRVNPATGAVSDEYLYSVRVDRPQWAEIRFDNLSQIDLVECLANFELKRKMTKTGIFKPIQPFDN